MAAKRIKKYKKFRKRRVVGPIILFVIFSMIMVSTLVFCTEFFLNYLLNTKMLNEYDDIAYLAQLYELEVKNGNVDYEHINAEGHDYIIVDKSGKVLYENGENTCSTTAKKTTLSMFSDEIEVYQDTKNPSIVIDSNGKPKIDMKNFKNWSSSPEAREGAGGPHIGYDPDDEDDENDDLNTIDVSDDDTSFSISYNAKAKMLNLPLWLSVDVNGGKERFIGKALFSFDMRETTTFAIIMGTVFLIVFFMVLGMLINVIRSIAHQNKVYHMFFSDVITKSHNWMYYIIEGERLLMKKAGSDEKYAAVNLTFVNYRNYCVCHSLEQGERMLFRVHDMLNRNLYKKEICAHASSSSNFALLLKFKDEDELRERLRLIISSLKQIDTGHKFTFQAGVCVINLTDPDGKKIRKSDISLEKEYNNACAARATLSDSDESGIAFFDMKLLEDQIWLDKVQESQERALMNEEFAVYYQPKYDPKTKELRGAEALIRWESPEFGFVTPGRFIPIFEKNGFITEIDHYMIKHVARDQKKWLDEGQRCVPVSVNVSRAHFIEDDLAEQIRDMVDAEGTPHNLIEIELTESAFFDDKKAMINTINKLKRYGFAVSMDDFGSGYSSLNSLKDMPLDVLKLDAEFFRGDNKGERGEIVVSEAIKLAKNLDMRIVAEGVEVKDQVDFLASQGCDMIQGYYFAKPMPKDEYLVRMQQVVSDVN